MAEYSLLTRPTANDMTTIKYSPGCCCCDTNGYDLIVARESQYISGSDTWQHPKILPKDNWQLVPNHIVQKNQHGGFDVTSQGNHAILEIVGEDSNNVLLRMDSVTLDNDPYAPTIQAIRVQVEGNTIMHVTELESIFGQLGTMLPGTDGNPNPFLSDAQNDQNKIDQASCEYLVHEWNTGSGFHRVAKRNSSLYLEFSAYPYAVGDFVQNPNGEPDLRGQFDRPPYIVESLVWGKPREGSEENEPTWPNDSIAVFDAEAISSLAVPLQMAWDERFLIRWGDNVSGPKFQTPRIGITEEERKYESGVTGRSANNFFPAVQVANVKCANPGYAIAMPPHHELPAWKTEISGLGSDATDIQFSRFDYTIEQEDWHQFPLNDYPPKICGDDIHHLKLTSVVRSNTGLGSTTKIPFLTLFDQNNQWEINEKENILHYGDKARYIGEAYDRNELYGFNNVPFDFVPPYTTDNVSFSETYTGKKSLKWCRVIWTMERNALSDDDVDIVATLLIHGEAINAASVSELNDIEYTQAYNRTTDSGIQEYMYVGAKMDLPEKDLTEKITYRKTIPRWIGALPTVILNPSDIVARTNNRSYSQVYWINGWGFDGSGTIEVDVPVLTQRRTFDLQVYSRAFGSLSPDPTITLAPSPNRVQAPFIETPSP